MAFLKEDIGNTLSMHYEEKIMGSICFLGVMQGKDEQPKPKEKDRLFVVVKVGDEDLVTLIDIGTSHNFVKIREAKWLGLKLRGKQGRLKIMNWNTESIQGVAWRG